VGGPISSFGAQRLLTREYVFSGAQIDNIHTARHNQIVVIPGCTTYDFECVHMHWRWGDVHTHHGHLDPMVEPSDDTRVSAPKGTPYLVPGQSIKIAVVRDKNGEAPFPDDPALKANDNEIISTTTDGYKVTGSYDPKLWYMSSVENKRTDTLFRHGIFVLKNVVSIR
jgi:hypothetical protein